MKKLISALLLVVLAGCGKKYQQGEVVTTSSSRSYQQRSVQYQDDRIADVVDISTPAKDCKT